MILKEIHNAGMQTCIRAAVAIVAIVVAAVMAVGCSGGRGGASDEGAKPSSRGLPYEVALLIPRGLYAGEVKDTLDAVLLGSTPGLPQHEPVFRLNVVYPDGHLSEGGFSGSHLRAWRTFRLRLLVDIGDESRVGVAYDVVARPQVEVCVTAPSPHALASLLSRERGTIVDLFVESELRREAAALRKTHSRRTSELLRELTDSARAVRGGAVRDVCVPSGLNAAKVGRDFLWTGTNLEDKDLNFLYFSYEWNGEPLTLTRFVEKHDSVCRANIPGSRAGQWMQVSRIDGRPLVLVRRRAICDALRMEVRGLWELRDGAMGGPFVALAGIDSTARRVEVVEGFVFSPHSPKRPLIRQMEAALRTFR